MRMTILPRNMYPETGARQLAWGAVVGVFYGVCVRLVLQFFPENKAAIVMTVGFIIFMPIVMGFVAVFIAERKNPCGVATWLLLPWASVAGALLASMLLAWEGLICILMFAPIALVLASIGGVIAGLIGRWIRPSRSQGTTLACIAILPLLIMFWEGHGPVLARQDLRTVANSIDINAPASVVWGNIERVRAIRSEELPSSWSHRIGFPDPIEATLSFEGAGGVRQASFTGGLLFTEIIDLWEPEKRLAFSIHAHTAQIPETTLDQHVRVGGQYFDVLRGEYDLEPLPNGQVRLYLSSRQRVSTDFNWYAHLWTDAIMADLQQRILHVVKQRCEAQARP